MLGDEQAVILNKVYVVKMDLNVQKQKMDLLAVLTSSKNDPPQIEKFRNNRPINTGLGHVKSGGLRTGESKAIRVLDRKFPPAIMVIVLGIKEESKRTRQSKIFGQYYLVITKTRNSDWLVHLKSLAEGDSKNCR